MERIYSRFLMVRFIETSLLL
ncbi:hypothetical protein D021_3153A, partial [Vibrio parahaemolyticus 10296]